MNRELRGLLCADRAIERRAASWYIKDGVMTFFGETMAQFPDERVRIVCPGTVSELHQMIAARPTRSSSHSWNVAGWPTR